MNKIEPMWWDTQFTRLCERFGKSTKNEAFNAQCRIYYESLSRCDRGALLKAVDALIDSAKGFPSPGEIKLAYREASAHQTGAGITPTMREGCAHCDQGWVEYTIPGNTVHTHGRRYRISAPCAYCFREYSIPLVIQRNGRIYFASRKIGPVHVQDLNNLEEIPHAEPYERPWVL